MAKKGQKFESYSFELKKKAIELRLQGMTKKKVAELLEIADVSRIKVWMSRYRQLGEYGLLDQRGRREKLTNEDRYVKRLELENAVLKKWLEITKQEVYRTNIASSTNCVKASVSPLCAKKLVSPEADTMRI